MKKIEKPEEIQKDDYLIIKWESIREAGYDVEDPATTVEIQSIYKCQNIVEWLKEIEQIEKSNIKGMFYNTKYIALRVGSTASVELSIKIIE